MLDPATPAVVAVYPNFTVPTLVKMLFQALPLVVVCPLILGTTLISLPELKKYLASLAEAKVTVTLWVLEEFQPLIVGVTPSVVVACELLNVNLVPLKLVA